MKRLISILCLTAYLLSFSVPALAAADEHSEPESTEPSNVMITVVMPAKTDTPEITAPEPIKVYPSEVIESADNGRRQIIKTYDLSPGEKPEDIPRESFERGGYLYSITDITRKETVTVETREYTETISAESESKEIEDVLPLLSPTLEYTSEDGLVGVLSLDVSSIRLETAGTKTSSYTVSVTREYPHLSSNDTSLVPKTVEERGKTYTLDDVNWRAGNTVTVDYDALPEYYTAVATYTATGSSTKVTGYTVKIGRAHV